jgi:glycosyltransferase involved in cell wall biosynthesis
VPVTPQSLTKPADKLAIVAPVFNDWSCVGPLIAGLEATSGLPADTTLFLVDDGSTQAMPTEILTGMIPIEVIRLGANIGHQRAIAVGLVRIAKTKFADAVIVIDADGEDLPADCQLMWQAHVANQSAVIVAQRLKRNESARFKLFYGLYRFFFRILTGRRLDFGNFSLLPSSALQRLVLMPELWNHYPSTIMKSRLEIVRIPLNRGERFAGRSRMNFISLVNHGLAGIAAFADTAYARLLAWSIAAMGLLGLATIGGVIYRLTNINPLPGWVALGATTAVVALFQIIAGLIVISFLTLSLRAQPNLPPSEVASAYISEEFSVTKDLFGNESSLFE